MSKCERFFFRRKNNFSGEYATFLVKKKWLTFFRARDSSRNSLNPTLRPNSDDSMGHMIDKAKFIENLKPSGWKNKVAEKKI